MKYRLKKGQENIQIVDGPDAGKKFKRGVEYDEVPAGENSRFERVPEPKPKTEKTATKKDAGEVTNG